MSGRRTRPGWPGRVGALAAPLALNDLLRAALRALEQFLIPWGLTRAGATRLGAMAAYGTVMGMVFPALMLPSAFLYALVDLLIPELAACRAQGRRERLASVTGQCLRAGLLFAGFTAGLLYALAEPLTAILYQSEQAGRLLRVFAPLALVLYLDALTDGMLKGLSEQVANVRYNTLTSALDAVLLVLLLPRWGLGGYIFAFAATHLLNFTLSLRRLLIVTGCPLRLGAALGVGGLHGAGALAAQLLPELESNRRGCCSARRSFPVCLFWLRVSAERRSAVCRRACGGCCICRNAAKKRRRFVDFFTEKSYNQSRI